ncbi:acyltransferase family protein [Paraburkholderia jirisanensis]
MSQPKPRLPELDSLRALAAIGVIGWHYTNHFNASPLANIMAPFYRHGLLLVDFFFVLSGFVLARTYWTDGRAGAFLINARDRIARIYPLHLAMLCVVATLQWVLVNRLHDPAFIYTFNDKRDFALNLLLLNRTGLERGFSYNAPSWSISTEFVANAVFLMSIVAPRKIASTIMAAIFVLSASIVIHNGLISNAVTTGIDNDVFRTLVGFFLGVALHSFDRRVVARLRLKAGFCDVMSIASVFAFLYYCTKGNFTANSDLSIAAVCFPALIIGAMRGATVTALLRIRPLIYLGTISYSIYLVHFPLQLAIHLISVVLATKMPYANAFFLIGFMFATIALASITYRFIELPGKRILRKFPRSSNVIATT